MTLNTSVIYFVTLDVEVYVKNTVVANQRESERYKTTTIAVTTKLLSMDHVVTVLLTVDGVPWRRRLGGVRRLSRE